MISSMECSEVLIELLRSCCANPVVRIIRVADFEAGVKGLDQAFYNVYVSGIQEEAGIQGGLLTWVKDFGNYIAPSRENDYKAALLKEYTKFTSTIERKPQSSGDEIMKSQEANNSMLTPELVLPEAPEVVVVTLAPRNAETALNQVAGRNIPTIWLTPGSSSQAVLEMAQGFGLEVIHDVCPVGILKMKRTQSKER